MESFATPYPLFFFDGDQEVDKGQIGIHSVLSFKRFQGQLSRQVGIPANQLSAVFVCRRTTSRDADKRQKLPINENTNFNIILNQHNPSKEKDCYFLVSLKKSKKERKGARRRNAEAENVDDDDSTSSRGDTSPSSQRPGKEGDEAFAYEASSPNSVLDPAFEPSVVAAAASKNNLEVVAAAVLPEPVKEEEALSPVVVERDATPSVVTTTTKENSLSPPVTRIGGQPLARNANSVEQLAKFVGVIGDQHIASGGGGGGGGVGAATFSDAALTMSQAARFKDPIQQQPVGRPGMSMQRGVPVFPDGVNMRLLTGRTGVNGGGGAGNLSFQQVLPNFHNQLALLQEQQQQQQQQARHFNFQQQRIARPSPGSSSSIAPGGGGSVMDSGYGRSSEQFCQDCQSYKERNIRPPPFHCCINDRITAGFRGPSPAGPIERPIKRQVKAAA
ncbi:hypothetical protein SELMODRAFT_440415 [Selaginella moellendorffii]|uniref:DUF7138 domain-containing protein n=1 Tax=Selaginella moellendorffii TaxID=88036 RepID=D8RBL3_SELML|nr:uncharacterized protein LOC9631437 [Selaginella moellendorffii]EFJ30816.1 hypothetical protein SELMODRAFT_440415 [Selaginella moellendorffii]|eukprot:XP_002968562.1 uncharacterized protein LOC9631437 [Selaginella moellendorffii]